MSRWISRFGLGALVVATGLSASVVLADAPSTSTVSVTVVPHISKPLRELPLATNDHTAPSREIRNEMLPHKGRAANVPPPGDAALQTRVSLPAAAALTATGVNFDGVGVSNSAPPDTNGRVGRNHFVQWVNTRLAVYDKTGALLYGPVAGNSLWTGFGGPCETHNDGDPIAQYDLLADRWVLTQFVVQASDGSHQCYAVSQTGDPLGSYYLYDFHTSSADFVDYPHVGVWPDGYYMTTHEFNSSGSAYVGQGLYVFERDKMLAGQPARFQFANLGAIYSGALPSDLDSLDAPPSGRPNYVVAPGSPELDGSVTPRIHIWKAATTWGSVPTFVVSGPTDVTTATFDAQVCTNFARSCVPQPSPATSSDSLDAISDRLMYRIAYRYFPNGTPGDGTAREVLVLNHTVKGGSGQAGVRWYEVRNPNGTPSIFQQGTYAPDANNRWMGSIAMDNVGNMAMGYSKSSTSVFPEIDIAGRNEADTAGTMQAEVQMKAGVGAQLGTSNRWGDYSAMTVDPFDGCTFWYTSEYLPNNGSFNWATRIASYSFSNCTAPQQGTITGTVTDCSSALPIPNALVSTGTGYSAMTDAAGHYSIIVPPGTYNVSASADLRSCTAATPVSVSVSNGGSTVQDFCLTGNPILSYASAVVDDSTTGNNNGTPNLRECVNLNVSISNSGCATATGVSGVLSTSTPGVIITQANSNYGDVGVAATTANSTPFGFATDGTFICGTPINFTITMNSSAGTNAFGFTVPTCEHATISTSGSLTASSPTQSKRLGRASPASSCSAPKTCPGTLSGSTGSRYYDAHTYANTSAVTACATVQISSACTNIYSEAYQDSFNPANLCQNYLADAGLPASGNMTYSVDLLAGHSIVIVVNGLNQGDTCSSYSLDVSGLIDNTPVPTPAVTPTLLSVDAAANGALSNGNGVFESGETVVVDPTWSNPGCAPVDLNGTASNFTGAGTAVYSIVNNSAAYGTINPGSAADCASSCYQLSIAGVRPAPHWDATFTETPSNGDPAKTWTLHVGQTFSDVPTSMLFYDKIETLLHYGITLGCTSATTYCPTAAVRRDAMAAFISRAMTGSDASVPVSGTVNGNPYNCVSSGISLFTDILPTGTFCRHVHYIASHGITLGCDATHYCPANNVLRDSMAGFIAREVAGGDANVPRAYSDPTTGRHYDLDATPTPDRHFTDTTTSIFDAHAHYLWAKGIVDGCTATTYCPTSNVTRQQMAKFISNAFSLTLYHP